MRTLADALPEEQARVRRLAQRYRDPILNGAGELAAQMMDASLDAAEKAVASGDVLAMMLAHDDLKGYE